MNLLFAWRYFRAKKSTNAINIIAWVSMSAIVVGAASLILVLSVFNGFEDLVKSLYTSFYPDIKVTPASGKTLSLTPEQLRQLTAINGVRAISRVVQDQVVLMNDNNPPTSPYLKGVDSNFTKVSGVADKIDRGKFSLGTADQPLAVLGSGIDYALAIDPQKNQQPLDVYLFRRGGPDYSVDPLASYSHASLATSGEFRIQQDFDDHYVITNLAFVKQMMGFGPDEYGAIELAVTDPSRVVAVQQSIRQLLGERYKVQTRYEQNQNLYSVMGTEKWVIYIVLTLILVVAAFNMVGALTMLVWDKQKDIHVLKALGAGNRLIQKIFLSEGVLLAMMGGLAGIGLAALICVLQLKYKLIPLEGGSFLLDYYPVKMVASDFLLVFGTILIVALLASWIPARKAAATPIELKS
ncbi:MAG TPA: FtsX-like permease family protein [Puia sp.]|jgi:lipoprotein-releasing system permease protein|nr:FtsX-like permease family protein [Puia sp.]